jgi:hypothetical protein
LDSNDEFFATIFQNAPVLESLKIYHNFSIIAGKNRLKKLSIGGDDSTEGKNDKFPLNQTAITYFSSRFSSHSRRFHPIGEI